MVRFTRAELESFRDAEVPDLLPADGTELKLLFVGINPGLWTAATQTHFAHPVNRFYPALLRAGIIERPIDPAAGMTDADRDYLRSRGIGITNVVRRATARAAELSDDELREGGRRLVDPRRAGAAARRRDRRRDGLPHGVRAAHGQARPPARAPGAAPSSGWCPTRAASTRTRPWTRSPTAYGAAARAAGVI